MTPNQAIKKENFFDVIKHKKWEQPKKQYFDIGDKVFLEDPNKPNRILQARYMKDPYTVYDIKVRDNGVREYFISDKTTNYSHPYHHTELLPQDYSEN